MEKILFVLIGALVFLSGFLSCYAINSVYIDSEKPLYLGIIDSKEQPSNWISEEAIQVFPDKIVINVENAGISRYADTGSMLPTLGENANGIRIRPKNAEEIKLGDIVTYQDGSDLIVHRVIGKGTDEDGSYFIMKGDNNSESDGKIYFKDVRYVTVGLIY